MLGLLVIKMDEDIKKKNILDLQFQKYLSISSTSIILIFTYFIGIGVAIVTKQIDLGNFITMMSLAIISVVVLGICSFLFFNALFHIRNIPEVIKELI